MEAAAGTPAGSLHAAYARLLDRAARAGWIEPGGLTPAEQCARLAAHERMPEARRAEWARLESVLDRAVYGGRGTAEELREGLEICERLGGAIGKPLAGSPAPAGGRRAGWVRRAAPGLLAALVLVAGVGLAPRVWRGLASLEWGGAEAAVPARGTWGRAVHDERRELAKHSDAWSRPRESPTLVRQTIDAVNSPPPRKDGRRIDLDTGTDGIFTNATDPFQPPLHWTHRQRIFTGIDSQYRPQGSRPGIRRAYDPSARGPFGHRATVRVELRPGVWVPIPVSAPDALVTDWDCTPAHPLKFTRGSADGLWVSGNSFVTVNLTYTLVSAADYREAPLPDAPFEPVPADLPENVRRDAAEVLAHVGGIPGATFRDTVRRLHAYCAGFAVAPIAPDERRENDFLTLAYSRKGVCRHRALVFFVLANAAGVRTRLVENRIHAFCEVELPGGGWRRMEFRLGPGEGAPGSPQEWPTTHVNTLHVFSWAGAIAVLIVGLSYLAATGLKSDARRHRLARTEAGTPAENRAERDDRLPGAAAVQALAALAARQAAEAGGALPPDLAERRRRLEEYASAAAPATDPSTLQRIHWDSRHVLRWLRRNLGDRT